MVLVLAVAMQEAARRSFAQMDMSRGLRFLGAMVRFDWPPRLVTDPAGSLEMLPAILVADYYSAVIVCVPWVCVPWRMRGFIPLTGSAPDLAVGDIQLQNPERE